MRIPLVIASFCLTGASLAFGGAGAYSVVPLQAVVPSDSVAPTGISAAGAVGFSVEAGGGAGMAAVYPITWQNDVAQPLALPQGYYGQTGGAGGGFVAGSIWPTTFNPLNPMPGTYGQPVLWSGGHLQMLSTLGEPSGEALAVNENGDTVGYLDTEGDPSDEIQPVLWSNGQTTILGSFPSQQARAVAINNQRQILLQASDGQSSNSYVWSSGSTTPIPTLGFRSFVANAINDGGDAVGGMSNDGDTGVAFLYHNSITAALTSLAGDTSENALAINNVGNIVGIGTDASGNSRALLWEDGMVIDLNALLPANSGWSLGKATAISDDGVIVGEGAFNGQEMGFELLPSASPSAAVPEPASLAVLALGATALLRRRRGVSHM